jgi:hypothetical protein
MHKIPRGYIFPSAAFSLSTKQIKFYQPMDRVPEIGDVVYGEVGRIGQHSSLENVSGRIHNLHDGSRALFVFGNRYAPDYYEGTLPERFEPKVDLLARSGMIGIVRTKKSVIKDPTEVSILGYAVDKDGEVINTQDFPKVVPNLTEKRYPRSPLILVVGTAMNSGKSMAAAACIWTLKVSGEKVRASKVTGTASLKDILHMNDAGAHPYNDFTYLGYPSTYLLPDDEMLAIFNKLDLRFGNHPKNYWVVEFADGLLQRETSMLLSSPDVRERVHRLILCANDAFGAIGGIRVLKEQFRLEPDAISGLCSSSPLHIRELQMMVDIPVFNSVSPDVASLYPLLEAKRPVRKLASKPAAAVLVVE